MTASSPLSVKRTGLLIVFVLFVLAGFGISAATAERSNAASDSAAPPAKFVPGEVLVRFAAGTSSAERADVREAADVSFGKSLPLSQLQLVKIEDGLSVKQKVAELESLGEVVYAEPNYIQTLQSTPNDPLFGEQYGLNNTGQTLHTYDANPTQTYSGIADSDIDAPEAWDIFSGNGSVKVAVVDTGVDYNHPDLADSVWTNPGESGGGKETNGIDDDLNGYVDDWHGYDVTGSDWENPVPDNDPLDQLGHGTHVAGIIGAKGDNNTGVTGVDQNAKIVPVKVFGTEDAASDDEVLAGLAYAGKIGAKVVNGSFGSGAPSQAINDVIAQYPNTSYAFAAGNSFVGYDVDQYPTYPCAYALANITCVGATNAYDSWAYFSNWGTQNVDLSAPGTAILSTKGSAFTTLPGDYVTLSGTSMATPMVAGALAMLREFNPSASAARVKAALLDGVDKVPALAQFNATSGRLNLATSLALINPGAGTATVRVANGHVNYSAGDGAANQVTFGTSGGEITIADTGATLAVGAGCDLNDSHHATCDATGVSGLRVDTGDMNDTIENSTSLGAEIDAGDGDDTITGGSGDDRIDGGLGTDAMAGGGGNDTANYSERATAVTLSADGVVNDGAAGENDSIAADVETLEGGAGADTIVGSADENTLVGNSGSDSLSGLDGDDVLIGGPGADTIDGGAGSDTVSYIDRSLNLSVSLDGVANDGGDGEIDNVTASVENVTGGSGNDTIVGSSGANVLDGGGGDDTVRPLGGADVLIGGSGTDIADYSERSLAVDISADDVANDGESGEGGNIGSDFETLKGGAGNDVITGSSSDNRLYGGPGGDTFNGGGGIDRVDYRDHTTGVTVTIDNSANDGNAGEGDNVKSDVENLTGTEYNDTLTGSASANQIAAVDGDDVLDGGDGDDNLRGGAGSDTLGGGAGADTADYQDKSGGSASITLDGVRNDGASGENDLIQTDVENVIGGDSTDTIVGDSGANYLDGGRYGGDSIYGGEGDDTLNAGEDADPSSTLCFRSGNGKTLHGGDGDDKLYGNLSSTKLYGDDGDDLLSPIPYGVGVGGNCAYGSAPDEDMYGGAGDDTVTYASSSYPVDATLDGVANDGSAGGTALIGSDVENLIGSATRGSNLVGNADPNHIVGGDGGDTIDGGAGSDQLEGAGGSDYLYAVDGAVDTVDCGDGDDLANADSIDTVDTNCEGSTTQLPTVSMQGSTMVAQSFGSIKDSLVMWDDDNLTFFDETGVLVPYVIVRSTSNPIKAGAGCLQYDSQAVRCRRSDISRLEFNTGDGNDFVFLAVDHLPSNINGGDGNDYLGGGSQSDEINGGAGDDTLDGGAGDDGLTPGTGADQVVGRDGFDRVSYQERTQPVTVHLDGSANDGESGENDDVHADVEMVLGGSGNDSLYGNDSVNYLFGGDGNDSIYGNGDNDVLSGEAGDDSSYGGDGADAIQDSAGDDSLFGGNDQDTLYSVEGNNLIVGNDGTDWVDYVNHGAGVNVSMDNIANDGEPGESDNVNADVENMFGSFYDDTITGSSANNMLIGMSGNDTISGMDGDDQLVGVDGNDSLDGGDGHDGLEGQSGDDTLHDASTSYDWFSGGDGEDILNYSDRTTPLDVSVDDVMNDGAAGEGDFVAGDLETFRLGSADDTFSGGANAEAVNGGDGNDSIHGGDGGDNLAGDAGSDQLFGDGGADLLVPGPDSVADMVSGGADQDQVAYTDRNTAVNVSLDGNANDGGPGEGDNVATDVEGVQGGAGNDTITGSSRDEYLAGNGGDDTIVSGGGADYLIGMDGDDTLRARDDGSDPDYTYCGDGNDTAYVDSADPSDSTCETFKTAPETTITAGPADGALLNANSPEYYFASDEAGVDFECQVDNIPYGPCPGYVATVAVTSADGLHTFRVKAKDGSVYDPTPATRTFTVDTVAPDTVIDSGPSGYTDEWGYSYAFHASESGTTFQCQHGTGASWVSCTSPATGSITLGGSLTFSVRAVDPAGNPDPTPASRTFTYAVPRLTAPSSTIPSSVNLTTDGSVGWVHWGLASTPNLTGDRKSGLGQAWVSDATQLGGGTLTRFTSGVPSYNWTGGSPTATSAGTTTAIANGGASGRGFRITAQSVAYQSRTLKLYVGAQNTTGKLTVSMSDGSAPTVTDTSVTSSSTTTPTNRVFSIVYRSNTTATMTVDWTQNTTSTASSSKVLLHSATVTAGVDTTAPDTTIATGPAEDSVQTTSTAAFTFTSSESGSTFECKLDTGAYATCAASYTTPTLADGKHTLKVRAFDAAGNVDAQPAVRSFWVVTPIGQLSQTNAAPAASTVLSTEGTTDWAQWGTSSASLSPNHKSGITQQISNATQLGGGTLARVTTGVPTWSWTGGTPTATSTGNTTAITNGAALGRGFRITVPAGNTAQRTLRLYVGAQNTTGKLAASLSDGSAVAISDTTVTSTSTTTPTNRVFTIVFHGSSASATLTVDWTQNTSSTASTSKVLLEAATLTTNSDTTAPTTTITSGPADGSVISGTSASFGFSVNESGSTSQCRVDTGAFTTCTSPFDTGTLASGTHTVTIRAIDTAGNVEPRPPVRSIIVP